MPQRSPTTRDDGGPLVEPAIRALRSRPVQGISRRALLRRSLGLGIGLWLTEVVAGSIRFVWPGVTATSARVRVGTLAELARSQPHLPILEGYPAYVATAKAFVAVVDPSVPEFLPGRDETGEGTLNVRALSQVCPHLGCRPNPCIEDFWFHCPCHQSRYDRLGIKPAGRQYGPAERSMDRFGVEVDGDGVLTIDTGQITLGPLPIAIGQPGVIPPRVKLGCS
jgi:hypothetical protein